MQITQPQQSAGQNEAADRLKDLGELMNALGIVDVAHPISPAAMHGICVDRVHALVDEAARWRKIHEEMAAWVSERRVQLEMGGGSAVLGALQSEFPSLLTPKESAMG